MVDESRSPVRGSDDARRQPFEGSVERNADAADELAEPYRERIERLEKDAERLIAKADHRPTPEEDAVAQRWSPKKGDAGRQDSASWHRLAGVGIEFIAIVGVMVALGWWLDKKLGTTPWLLIAGCGVGFAGGLWSMVKAAKKMMG